MNFGETIEVILGQTTVT